MGAQWQTFFHVTLALNSEQCFLYMSLFPWMSTFNMYLYITLNAHLQRLTRAHYIIQRVLNDEHFFMLRPALNSCWATRDCTLKLREEAIPSSILSLARELIQPFPEAAPTAQTVAKGCSESTGRIRSCCESGWENDFKTLQPFAKQRASSQIGKGRQPSGRRKHAGQLVVLNGSAQKKAVSAQCLFWLLQCAHVA